MMKGLSQIAPCMSLHVSSRTLLLQMPCAQDGLKIQIHPHGHIPLYSQTPLPSHSSLSLWALRTAWQNLLSDPLSASLSPYTWSSVAHKSLQLPQASAVPSALSLRLSSPISPLTLLPVPDSFCHPGSFASAPPLLSSSALP